MDLPRGTRIGVDARSTLHKSVFANARDIYFEKAGSHTHRAVFVRHLQQLLHAGMEVVVLLDGARWPLKSTTHSSRRNKQDAALESQGGAHSRRLEDSSSSRPSACRPSSCRGSSSTSASPSAQALLSPTTPWWPCATRSLWNQGARDDRWHAAGSVELALRSVCGVHCQSDAQWHTENMTRTANICARADSYVPAPAAGA